MNDLLADIWQIPDINITLQDNEAHLWLVNINKSFRDLDYYTALLSPEEKKRSGRFHFSRDKNRNIITYAVLRLLISNYINIDPAQVMYKYNQYNKPEVANRKNSGLGFNLSHSGNYIIYAFSLRREVGIDIEQKREINYADSIVKRFCSEKEKTEYFSFPPEQRNEIFLCCWTRKEAYIKARGEGLNFQLNNFTVSLNPADPPALLDVSDEPFEKQKWSLYDIEVHNGYYSTLAAEGKNLILRFFKWDRK